MADEIKINMSLIKEGYNHTKNFLKNKRNIWILTLILLLVIVSFSSSMRVQNLPLLEDSTSGKYVPLALDPFYFLRVAETILEQGDLPEVDEMRYPSAKIGFMTQISPQIVVLMYKFSNIFGDYSLQYIDILYPVIFFLFGLIVFFFLAYNLTRSKIVALISTTFLAIIPSYLYRTVAGFSDHESAGMFAFFLTLLVFTLALKYIKKDNNKYHIKTIIWSLGTALATGFTIAVWGGISLFLYIIIPMTVLILWLLKAKHGQNKELIKYIIFYSIWIIFGILFSSLFNQDIGWAINKYLIQGQQLIALFVLGFILIDYFLIHLIKRKNIDWLNKKYRILYTLGALLILGALFLTAIGENIFSSIGQILDRFIHPFGTGRTGLTVAENRQPFLNEWISQIGKWLFWLFFAGIIFLGIEISKGIREHKNKFLFVVSWIIMVSGVLFSRISADSLFNGTNLISRLFYFSSLILFAGVLIYIYFKDEIKIKERYVLMFSWVIITLISAKSAVRIFFVITPLAMFIVGFSAERLIYYTKNIKDDLMKIVMVIISIGIVFILITSFMNFSNITAQQARQTGPSANDQWQKAMFWVRENTPEDAIFVHWWDYGYWVQYLGERATVTDGGHAVPYWDHLIGRYVLTTPQPETALSFFKTHDVSYFLIDPTDFGKYGAYSRIGSGPEGRDRYSQLSIMSRSQQNQNEGTILYQGGTFVDEDIIYNSGGEEIFLPSNNAFIGGVILRQGNNQNRLGQPSGIYVYNNQQISIPLRYLYDGNNLIDFGEGLKATAVIVPRAIQNGQQFEIDNLGAVIYLSPKVTEGLYAQLYLLNDAFENYDSLNLVHSQDPLGQYLNSQGANLDYYVIGNNLRGPIKIWEVSHSENIPEKEEFLRKSGEYAEFDNLNFVK